MRSNRVIKRTTHFRESLVPDHEESVFVEPLESRVLLSGTHYVVDSLLDVVADDGVVTLREAIEAANTNVAVTGDVLAGSATETDRITFDALLAGGTITLGGAELAITESLDIIGSGVTIDANQQSRVFYLAGSSTAVELEQLTITGGAATEGGGIYNDNVALTLTGATFSDNHATQDGGGVLVFDQGSLVLSNCLMIGNAADDDGGAIFSRYGEVVIVDSLLQANTADDGGAIHSYYGTIRIDGSVLTGNAAAGYGGAIHGGIKGNILATNTVFSCNYAAMASSAIDGNMELAQCTVAGNVAGDSVALAAGWWMKINNSIVALNVGGDLSGHNAEGEQNLIGVDPGFVRNPSLGPDGVWGTADDDFGDLHLTDRSLAVNLGDNSLAVDSLGNPLLVDLEGNARIVDGTVDLGAYEYQGAQAAGRETPATVVTSTADLVDPYDGLVTLREAMVYSDLNDAGPTVTFDSSLTNVAIHLADGELYANRSMTIDASAIGGMLIEADGHSRVFQVFEEGQAFSFIALRIAEGMAYSGGGILNHVQLTLTDCLVGVNTATGRGGGIYNGPRATLTLNNCKVMRNTAAISGGGIYNAQWLTVSDSLIYENQARTGGGIYNIYSLEMDRSTVSLNTAVESGGGIFTDKPAAIRESTISDNTAGENGGGAYNDDTYLTLIDCEVNDNEAANDGGGVYNYHGTLTLTSSEVAGNSAGNHAGGIFNNQVLNLTDTHVRGNTAIFHGGGILNYSREAESQMLRTRIYNNEVTAAAGLGAGIYNAGDAELTLDDCLITGNDSPTYGGGIYNTDAKLTLDDTDVLGNYALHGAGIYNVDQGNVVATSGKIMGNRSDENGGGIYNDATVRLTQTALGGNEASCGGGIYNDELGTAYLTDMSVYENEVGSDGGGIYNYYGDITLTQVTVHDNQYGTRGGGIYIARGNVTLIDSLVCEHAGSYYGGVHYGGGIYLDFGTVELIGTAVSDNSASLGAGIFVFGGDAILTDSSLTDNTALGFGGGVYVARQGRLTLLDATITNNTAEVDGGGICCGSVIEGRGGRVTAIGLTLTGNASGRYGGGLFETDSILIQLTTTLMAGNTAYMIGGAIYSNSYRNVKITNATIAGNSSITCGGIFSLDRVVLNNSIVTMNHAFRGDADIYGDYEQQYSLISVDPSFVRNPDDGGDGWGDDPFTSGIDESANDDCGNLRVQADSPAINEGKDSLLPTDQFDLDDDGNRSELIPFDVDGNARIIGGRVDIGAYESPHLLAPVNGDFDGDKYVGLLDLDILGNNYGMTSGATKAEGDANGDGAVGLLDLDILGYTWETGAAPAQSLSMPGDFDQGRASDAVQWWQIELEEEEVMLF